MIVFDIYGNMIVWEVVFRDIWSCGIECIFCLGDFVGKGLDLV